VIEPLTGYIWLGAHPLHDSRLVHVASLFQSLAAGLRTLDEFYRTIPVVRPSSPLAGRLFPHVSSYVDTEGEVRFRYLSKLEGHSPEKAVFKAKRERDHLPIVVKFAHRYNADAHRVLADKGLAPRLFYVGNAQRSIPGSSGLFGAPQMVVMEYLSGSPAHELFWKGPLPSSVFKDVRTAIDALHERNVVFGDLRRPNIMVLQWPPQDREAWRFKDSSRHLSSTPSRMSGTHPCAIANS
jgi:hypothetical protein